MIMKNNLFFTILFCFFVSDVYAQKESNNWYFGEYSGIAFSSGVPMALYNSAMYSWNGCSTISDTTGNLLFYTNGEVVYNRNHQQMPNGSGLLGGNGTQNCIIVPYPGNQKKYYIFTVGIEESIPPYPCVGLYYSIVNMALDGGRGDIEPFFKNMALSSSDKATYKITAVRHKNNTDVWVIVRNLSAPDNEYHSYLITPAGINTIPVRSPCLTYVNATSSGGGRGQMKVSPDGKLIFASIYGLPGNEIGSFNASTGEINIWFTFYPNIINSEICGVEFSQDTRFLYLSTYYTSIYSRLIQYEVSLLPDESSFLSSMKIIAEPAGVARDLQMGPDGKIYVARYNKEYLGVINNPGEEGIACGYDTLGVYLGGRKSRNGLPQFIQSYFLRFSFEGNCAGEPIRFTPNFNPLPDSIHWDFGDPGSGGNNVSVELNPQHIYSTGGTYTVTVFVRFPDGRTETASRDVIVSDLPQPYPGNDTTVCKGSQIQLQATTGFESYLWSTGPTAQSITVADTGYYWVEALNTEGCTGRDTVQVSWFPVPTLNETNLILSPTTCGGSTGAIRGLTVSGTEPIVLEWKNNAGTVLSNEEDIFNLPVGNYYLWATDGNGCNNLISQYTISDAGDVLIASVSHSDSYCGQNNGSITITAVSGLSDLLEYSIDNGNTWQNNEGLFEDLAPGPHNVWVKVPDGSGCQAVYASNPVMIDDFSGPQVTASSDPATGSNPNGSITLTAAGFGNLSYFLNGGTPQSSNEFTGLIAGTYTWRVEDENGCFTEGSIEVGQEAGFIISAIAGNSAVCLGNAPIAPLLIENFTGVQAFTATLEYDATLVNCEGFRPGSVHPQLEANLIAEVYPASQRIVVTWAGSAPLTLTGTVTVLDLVFSATQAGNSFLTWDQAPAATWFTGEYGSIEPEFQIGQIQVNNPPVLAQQFPVNVCEGELAWLTAPGSGNEPLTYQWTLPDGSTSQNSSLMFFDASTAHSGQYRVKVADPLGCSDSTLLTLQVTPNPRDWFLQDTILFENQYLLAGPAGYATYLWSTGDTLPEITVNTEGLYTLQLTTHNLCAGVDSTYLKMPEAESPFLVLNAFTPNNDGLNDTFHPVTDYDRFSRFSMIIYNSWGQRQFETTNPAEGWDGKDAAAGVYVWVITYVDYLGKVNTLRGSVTLIK